MFSPAVSGAARSRLSITPRQQLRSRRRSWNEDQTPVLPTRNGSKGERLHLLLPDETSNTTRRRKFDLENFTNAVLYGVINSILTIPCMYGYAAIIFSHPDFASFMPSLSKLVMFSSVVHQVMFTLLSSLPFAIGQVQDAGLIFLSAIATSICTSLGADVSVEAKVATVVVTIGIATATLGICLVLIGRFKLAGLVSYLPMPVVGGYLAYIGLFCLYAGLSLSTGLVINDFTSLLQILDVQNIVLCIPGVLGGLLLLVVSQRCESSFALPACILGLPLAFYVMLPLFGADMDDARDYGWVSPSSPPANFLQMWDLFDFAQVYWSQIPKQITTWLGMVFVVSFSSCLDVAAIEMDMGSQLAINHELASVGWSNVVSGLFGGYTGSYIFSQTIFTYRSKTNSRVVGVCVIISEFAIVLLPLSVMSYVPRFFFAATLIFIAIDLMVEWLVHVYHKILPREYVVLWMSFIAINWVSLELGMLLGIFFAILNFMIGYAQVRVVNRKSRKSAAVRKYAARTIISQKRESIVYLELYGYLFFGSSVQILEDVQKEVHVRAQNVPSNAAATAFKRISSSSRRGSHANGYYNVPMTPVAHLDVPIECLDGSPAANAQGLPTEYLVMDFGRVSGMDATAARSSFMILQQMCKRNGITVLFADVLPEIRKLLLGNDIVDAASFYPTADSAIEWCENQLLASTNHAIAKDEKRHVSMSVLLHRFMGEPDDSSYFNGVDLFFKKHTVAAGHEFYRVADFPEHFYFLATGRVALYMNSDGSGSEEKSLVLLEHVLPGAMFGEVDFFGRQYRYMCARATEPCVVFEMSRATYDAMDQQAPELWNRLRDVVMQSMALAITNTTSINSFNYFLDNHHA
uniref:STAS domain-containing protein n=1 Tax=Globisporangium ultimum (strain ATCC 200006 / CBS 805.95 / DAOM BR144) TaxID=431595 RepID=K3WTS9_GLOUD